LSEDGKDRQSLHAEKPEDYIASKRSTGVFQMFSALPHCATYPFATFPLYVIYEYAPIFEKRMPSDSVLLEN